MGSRMEPLIQVGAAAALGYTQIYGNGWDSQNELREVPFSITFLLLWYLGRCQVTPGSQMGQGGLEGGLRQLQGCQPELSARESPGAAHPGCQENQGISPASLGLPKGGAS